jgi:hypothetical protein
VTVEGYAKRLLPRSPRDVVGMLAPHGSVEAEVGRGEGRVVQVGGRRLDRQCVTAAPASGHHGAARVPAALAPRTPRLEAAVHVPRLP